MRLSTSPVQIRHQIPQKINYTPNLLENSRSSSLSNTPLHSSKFQNQIDNSYYSPYYNQNSIIRISPSIQTGHQNKNVPKWVGNSQNSSMLENSIKILTQRVENIQKRMKKQQIQIKTLRETNDQKHLVDSLQQRISKQIQKKSFSNNELLIQEIKRIESQIWDKIQHQSKNQLPSIGSFSILQSSRPKAIQNEQIHSQRKNIKIIEEKVKQEIFKLQIHLENEINKSLKSLKYNSQNSLDSSSFLSIVSKSKLKYKYRPMQIYVKNQVSVRNQAEPIKRRKQTLSTTNSSGCSEQNQIKGETKVVQFQQQIYYIDKEGYLLDQNGFYLLDDKEKMIKIDKKLIKKLKELKIID